MAEGKEKFVVEATTGKSYRIVGRSRFDNYVECIEAIPSGRMGKEYTLVRFSHPNIVNVDVFNDFYMQRNAMIPKLRELSTEEEYYIEIGDEQAYLGFKGRLQDVEVNNAYDRNKPASYFEPIRRFASTVMGNMVKEFTRSYRKSFFLSLAKAVRDLHREKIVHGGISPFNIGVLEGKAWIGGFYTAFIEGNDPLFVKDEYGKPLKRKEIAFYSPEMGSYYKRGHEAVDRQTDIFSLGLYMHWCLTGELPAVGASYHWRETSVDDDYTWKSFGEGDRLELSLRLRGEDMRNLLSRMLCYAPENRLTAEEVYRYLDGMADVDFLLYEDDMGYEPYGRSTAGRGRPRETERARSRETEKPRVAEEEKRAEPVVEVNGFEEPYGEHGIAWNEDKLRARGFVGAKCKEQAGVKGYDLYRSDLSATFFTKDKLTMMGYAVSAGKAETEASSAVSETKVTPVETVNTFCEPWEEHSIEMDIDFLKSRGYVGAKQEVRTGVKGYLLYTASGEPRFMKAEMLRILKLAKTVEKVEEKEVPLFAENDAVKAFCMGQVRDEGEITALEDEKTQVEDACRQYAKQAFECACRYYLQIKKTQVDLAGEEETQYEKAQSLLSSLGGEKGEIPSLDGVFADISAALETLKGISLQTLPKIELPSNLEEADEDSAVERYSVCDTEGIAAQVDAAFDGLRQAIEESANAQDKQETLDEVFLINEMMKEQAQNWVDDHLETLVKSEEAATAIFLKADYELWTDCAEKLIVAMDKIDALDLAMETEKERAAKEYWQSHREEICERIRNGEFPTVSEEIKRILS